MPMKRHEETNAALVALLKTLGAEPGVPLSLCEIGPPLLAEEFTQNEILHALYPLKDHGVIDLIEDNRLESFQRL
jgi:hypothetical protein